MPFDSTNFDYTKVTPVYDKDNPPKRMSEAIRMAVADVEAQERLGIEYEWGDCNVCTAGAVVRARKLPIGYGDIDESTPWGRVLGALSQITEPYGMQCGVMVDTTFGIQPTLFAEGFASFDYRATPYQEDSEQFKSDMLALADRLEAEGS